MRASIFMTLHLPLSLRHVENYALSLYLCRKYGSKTSEKAEETEQEDRPRLAERLTTTDIFVEADPRVAGEAVAMTCQTHSST